MGCLLTIHSQPGKNRLADQNAKLLQLSDHVARVLPESGIGNITKRRIRANIKTRPGSRTPVIKDLILGSDNGIGEHYVSIAQSQNDSWRNVVDHIISIFRKSGIKNSWITDLTTDSVATQRRTSGQIFRHTSTITKFVLRFLVAKPALFGIQ